MSISAAGAVGTCRADNTARFPGLAAFVKRGTLGLFHSVALYQRPRLSRNRKGTTTRAVEAQLDRTFARAAIGAGVGDRGATRDMVPGNSPSIVAGIVDDRSPRLQILHL